MGIKILFPIGFFLFFLFILFSYLVQKDIFTQFDFDTTVKLQDNISRVWDQRFSLLSLIGSFEIATIFLLILLIIRRRLSGFITLFLWGTFHVIEVFGKSFVDHLPPPEFLLRTEKIVEFPQFHIRQEFSYPSGHAGRAMFLTLLFGIFIFRSKRLSSIHKIFILSLFAIYDVLMLVSRVYLGEHWASDVLGGALLGASLALLVAI